MNTNLNIFGDYKFTIELSVTLVLTLANLGFQEKAHLPNSLLTLNQIRQTREISYEQVDELHQICDPHTSSYIEHVIKYGYLFVQK